MLVHLILAHHILVHAHLRLTHAHSGHPLLWVVSPVVHRSPGWPAGLLLRVALGIATLLGKALGKVVLRKIATEVALILWVPARLGVHGPIQKSQNFLSKSLKNEVRLFRKTLHFS